MEKVTEKTLVYWGKNSVGELCLDDNNRMSFTYHDSWHLALGQKISVSLPITSERYTERTHNFFANLLPEGDFRSNVERIFKVSPGNDYSLLKEIGEDCAGVLSIGRPQNEEEGFYEVLSKKDLLQIIDSAGLFSLAIGNTTRLSLAGAQGKLALHRDKDGLKKPFHGAPSSVILKFNRTDKKYPRLVENEFFMTQLARRVGLKVVDASLETSDGRNYLVIKRYDRVIDQEHWPHRVHQEDFCQALNNPHYQKYQKEGGPSFASCQLS